MPLQDKTGETCACITRYEKEETLEFVIKTMLAVEKDGEMRMGQNLLVKSVYVGD